MLVADQVLKGFNSKDPSGTSSLDLVHSNMTKSSSYMMMHLMVTTLLVLTKQALNIVYHTLVVMRGVLLEIIMILGIIHINYI